MTKEVWREASGFEKHFLISTMGRVFSKRSNKILRQSTNDKGYYVINTRLNGRGGSAISLRVHRLVALTFLPNHKDLKCVNHLDGNKKNNAIENLEWCDYSRNLKHAWDTGLRCREKGTTLSPEQQDIAFKLKQHSGYSNRAIAKKIGVGPGVIHRLMRTKSSSMN